MMPTPNPPPGSLDPATLSRELYDFIMSKIEPDLTSIAIPTLMEKYKGESAEDRMKRMEYYDNAFAVFDGVLQDASLALAEDAHQWRQEAQTQLHAQEEKEKAHDVAQAEAELDSSADARA